MDERRVVTAPEPRKTLVDDDAEMVELGEWDWWQPATGRKLHAATVEINPDYDTAGWGRTACGRGLLWLSIPGVFTRMGAKRCVLCCDALGYPHGTGSPKNDPACRPLVEARIAEMAP